ncbi:MAG: caspase family protein [Novosphingobium sp.]|nr:caspase family protein [Novosphingobium sp.]
MAHRREVLGGAAAWAGGSFLGAFPARAAETGNLAALILGIDRYASLRPLERAVNDARSIAAKVAQFGYDAVVLENSGSEQLLAGLERFLAKITPDTSAFVFAACHGIQVAGQNFILPADADGTDAARLLESSLQAGELLNAIARSKPRQCIAIFDACRNDPVDMPIPGLGAGFASINAPGGFYVAYSAGEGQFALDSLGEGDASSNGVFTRYLLEQMDGSTLIDDIVKNVREEVIVAAQGVGHNQCPAIYDQAGRDLRLDGQRVAARRRVKSNPRLDGAGVLIVANQEYPRYSEENELRTPHEDARRLARDFERLGATVTSLFDASREEILAASREIAAKDFNRRFAYLSGHGGAQEFDAWMLVPAIPRSQWRSLPKSIVRGIVDEPQATVATSNPLPSPANYTLISVGEIVAALTAPPPPADNRTKGAERRGLAIKLGTATTANKAKAHIFCDFGLIEIAFTPQQMALAAHPRRHHLLRGDLPNSMGLHHHPGLSLLFSSSPEQRALDTAPDLSSSPFAIAIANALGQPGLSVAQFADRVRSQVETLTRRFQTPILYCDEETLNQVMIDAV